MRGLAQRRMIGQPEIIVRAQVDDSAPPLTRTRACCGEASTRSTLYRPCSRSRSVSAARRWSNSCFTSGSRCAGKVAHYNG